MNIILTLIVVILIAMIGYGLWNRLSAQRWLEHPLLPGKLVKCGDKHWYVNVSFV